jgi:hypothetical protein
LVGARHFRRLSLARRICALSGMGQTLLHLRAQTRWNRMVREVH